MGGRFDLEGQEKKLKELKERTLAPGFYDDIKLSTETNIKISNLEKIISDYNNFSERINASLELIELVTPEEIDALVKDIELLELSTYLSGPYDNLNCYLEIHAGAGGTESCDWSAMLLRMYERFCEKNGFKYEELDVSKGEEAGFKSALIKISGTNAFGYLKKESGVHRLVRISPFDANKRRHTSFASVSITPEFNNNIEIEINEKDLKIDVFHSSGAGGQSVNTSNSAVRITHIPSKIVVSVQNERSQLKNKEIAMSILKSKLYALKLAENEKLKNEFKLGNSINFGSQIRSYILEPYKLVKDTRSGYENADPEKILNGDIMPMLEYNLKSI